MTQVQSATAAHHRLNPLHRSRGFAALAGLILSAAIPALAQEIAPEVTVVVPQARTPIIHPRHPHPDPMPHPVITLSRVEVSVSINDQVATTTLTLTLANGARRPMEAQVLLPVPDGAAVRSFQLDSLGSEPTAKILPRDEARRIYDAIVRQMKDPGLLEFAGHNQIRSSVFPVPANGQETVRLTYEHLLTADGNRIDFVLPRSDTATRTVWTFSAELRSSRSIATVFSPSHDISTERHSKNHISVRVSTEAAAQPGSLRLSYLHEANGGDGIAATFMAYPDPQAPAEGGGKGGYFMLLAALPEGNGSDKAIRREVTIVIDRSGSMRGEKMDQAREAARQVIEGLLDGEAFNIIDFASDVQMFSRAPVIKSGESMKAARGYLGGINASGGTNIYDALHEALRQPPTEGMLPVVLFLTDGVATVGRTREGDIRELALTSNTHERRIFTFGVGFDVNAPLLSALARESRATSTFVLPTEDVEVAVSAVFRRLSGPVLASPRLTVIGPDGKESTRLIRDLEPSVLPDVFEGDQLIVLGRYTTEGPMRLKVEGNFRGKPRTFDLTMNTADAGTRHAHVPRLWAGRRIASLVDEIRRIEANTGRLSQSDPRTRELVDEIVRLSTRYGILTEYTAFLAVEPGADFANVPRIDLAESLAFTLLDDAGQQRAGAPAVARERGQSMKSGAVNLGRLNTRYDADQNAHQFAGVQNIGDRSLFLRGNRWVDAQLLKVEDAEAEVIVEFATPAYDQLVERLARDNLQGLLANPGETYLLVDGQRVLVRGPSR